MKWQKIQIYPQLHLKSKLSKQEEQRQNHGYGERFDGCQMGGECGGMVKERRGLRSTNRWLQNSHGDVQDSIGNGVAKEYTYDPLTLTMVGGWPHGVGCAGFMGERG